MKVRQLKSTSGQLISHYLHLYKIQTCINRVVPEFELGLELDNAEVRGANVQRMDMGKASSFLLLHARSY